MSELDKLGIKHGTDKSSKHHNYLHHYEFWLSRFKGQKIICVDAIGGYAYPDKGGESLRMWAEWQKDWTIVGIDLYPKDIQVPSNVVLFQADQTDEARLKEIFEHTGRPHVFIEDFSHIPSKSIKTFEIIFPLLESGGIFISEDTEGSFWNTHGFDGNPDYTDFNFNHTLNYFRKLTNEVQGSRYIANFVSTELGKTIESIHFYANFVLIKKR